MLSELPSLVLFFFAAAAGNPALATWHAQATVDAQALRSEFAKLDADGDGYVSRTEALKDPEVLRTFRRADRDKDGRLDLREFAVSAMLSRAERPKEYVRARMAAAD